MKELGQNILMLLLIVIFIMTFQSSYGPITYVHIFETCDDTGAGIAYLMLYINVNWSTFLSMSLIRNFGNNTMFLTFAAAQVFAYLYVLFLYKDTSYIYNTDEHGVKTRHRMTDNEKMMLYQPAEFKENLTEDKASFDKNNI
jgi:hypothetical protein